MAFSATYIQITLRYLNLGQECQTARCYAWDGLAIATATPAALGEAWWNHYKDAWRSCLPSGTGNGIFTSVLVREVGGGLAYGEYSIPTGEQQGTRPAGELGSQLPSYAAVGVRLAVSSGVTRPGQFRVPFLNNQDVVGNLVGGAFLELASDLADLYSQPNILGAPTATGELIPSVVRFGVDHNTIAAGQPIVGFVANGFATSQVSRRYGNGS